MGLKGAAKKPGVLVLEESLVKGDAESERNNGSSKRKKECYEAPEERSRGITCRNWNGVRIQHRGAHRQRRSSFIECQMPGR